MGFLEGVVSDHEASHGLTISVPGSQRTGMCFIARSMHKSDYQ